MVVGNLITKLGLDSSAFDRGMVKAEQRAGKFGKKTEHVGFKLDKLARTAIKAGTVLAGAFAVAGSAALRAADEYEKSRIVFGKLLGSMAEGEKMLKRLDKFSIATPFQPKEVETAAQTLLGFGLEANKVIDTLGVLGDISKGNGQVFQDLARVYGEARAEGKLMSKDIRQFIAAGVPITKMLAESMGALEGEIFDMASKGKISFSVLETAFEKATSEGGMFHEMMLAQSQTLSGLESTLKGKFNVVMRELGAVLLPGAKVAASKLNEQMDTLLEHIGGVNKNNMADNFVGVIYAIEEAFALLFKNIQRGSGLLRGVIAFMRGDLEGAGKAFEQWAEGFKNVLTGGLLDEWRGVRNAFWQGAGASAEQWDPFGFMNRGVTTDSGPLLNGGLGIGTKKTTGGGGTTKTKGKDPFNFDTWLTRFMEETIPVMDDWVAQQLADQKKLIEGYNAAADEMRNNERPDMPGIGGDDEPTNLESAIALFGSESEGMGLLGKIGLAKKAISEFGVSWAQIAEQFPEFAGEMVGAASAIGNAFVGVFDQIIKGGFKMGEFMKQMLMTVIKQALKALAIFAALSIFTMGSGAGITGVAALLGMKGNAGFGAIFGKLFTGFAEGGIVNKPTMGLVGEYPSAPTDPEIIGRASTIGRALRSHMGGGMGGGMQLTTRVEGKDLLLILREASFDNGINGGPRLVFE